LALKLCKCNKPKRVRLPLDLQQLPDQVQRRTFILVTEALVLPHQVIVLRLQLLDVIVVLGESGVELGLHGSRVLPRLQKLILQCFSPEHCVTEAL
jgi:hypothetical protein